MLGRVNLLGCMLARYIHDDGRGYRHLSSHHAGITPYHLARANEYGAVRARVLRDIMQLSRPPQPHSPKPHIPLYPLQTLSLRRAIARRTATIAKQGGVGLKYRSARRGMSRMVALSPTWYCELTPKEMAEYHKARKSTAAMLKHDARMTDTRDGVSIYSLADIESAQTDTIESFDVVLSHFQSSITCEQWGEMAELGGADNA